MIGALLGLLIVLVVCGLILWALTQFPLDATIAKLIKVVVIVFAVIAIIYVVFPLLSAGLSGAHLGR